MFRQAADRHGAVPALLSPGLAGPVVGRLPARLHHPWPITDRAKLEGPLKDVAVSGLWVISAGSRGWRRTGAWGGEPAYFWRGTAPGVSSTDKRPTPSRRSAHAA
ncbi:hypothetical protein ABZU45_33095 [Streptomyces avermitilis]|uniref:hypothetical protein n=1 Tax=Streptomyces avermitilis TaxID=33903 RepID=UPI0033AE9D49